MPREEKNLNTFVKAPVDKWVESAYETEGPLYMAALAANILSPEKWQQIRITFLKRILAMAHIRSVAPGGTTT